MRNFFKQLIGQGNEQTAANEQGHADAAVVALVGHCGADAWSLKRFAERALPGCRVISVNDQASLTQALESASVLLINRALDGRFDARSGVELIAQMRAERSSDTPPAILVSNYESAQRDAETAGALPGFGKADLRTELAVERLQAAAGAQQE